MSGDPKRLLGGYATDTLSAEERRELLRAALDDQALFDAVLEEEGLRELLETPGARQQVLEGLGRPTAWERVRGWFARPATFGDLAAVAGLLVAAFAGYQILRVESPDTGPAAAARPALSPVAPAALARLLALPPREGALAGLEADSGEDPIRVRAGEPLMLRATLRAPARVLLIAETSAGSALQVHPAPGRPPLLVEAPPSGGPAILPITMAAPDRPGAHRLRLVMAPVDVHLEGASPADVDGLRSRLKLIDLTYEVTAP